MNVIFDQEVSRKFHLYNSLFLRLPFELVKETGVYLPILQKHCDQRLAQGQQPLDIVNDFFKENMPDSNRQEQLNMLFSFIKYIERQVVLFDATESAAYDKLNQIHGEGSLQHLVKKAGFLETRAGLGEKLRNFHLRVVLTAHPTQFYPNAVLRIIDKLSSAIRHNDLDAVDQLLKQLAKTPFFSKEKPTPYQEAKSLIWYLKNTFYDVIPQLIAELDQEVSKEDVPLELDQLIAVGFWPGGDRDGNPFVNSETTKEVALALKRALFRKYYSDLSALRKKLSFRNVQEHLQALEDRAYLGQFTPEKSFKTSQELLNKLLEIRKTLVEEHSSLFLEQLDAFIQKVKIFGLHFAELDIRQDSSILRRTSDALLKDELKLTSDKFLALSESEQITKLCALRNKVKPESFKNPQERDLIDVFESVRWIQENNGQCSCRRFIISNTQTAVDVMRLYSIAKCTAWPDQAVNMDFVPLFETIDDLNAASHIMSTLYKLPVYHEHLVARGMKQTIMLGFSDGTKDGGYLSSNWSIFQAKEELTKVSNEHGITLAFFDGRGGPPARGGGNTHKFYASMGNSIANKQIQLTIQGQTISSHFGSRVSAKHNLEQLLSAGIGNDIFQASQSTINNEQRDLLAKLSRLSLDSYCALKDDPRFLQYLQRFGPLNFYGRTNIGSRPSSRDGQKIESLKSLRAIPFVSTCSQMKQNIPGFYGLGTALQQLESEGQGPQLIKLYSDCRFFRALIDNSMQSLKKCSFSVTAFIEEQAEFGEFWRCIRDEYELTKSKILKISGFKELMFDQVEIQKSIDLREQIMLPLVLIQQYALAQLRDEGCKQSKLFEQMVVRTMYGIVNASRNSA